MSQPLRVCGDATYAPYEFYDGDAPVGLNVEMWQALARRLGEPLDMRLGPWGRAQEDMLSGACDALSMLTPTPARRENFEFSSTVWRDETLLFARRERVVELAARPLAGMRIAVTPAGYPRQALLASEPNAQFVLVADTEAGLAAVAAGDADAFASAARPAWHAIRTRGYRAMSSLPHRLAPIEAAIALRRGDVERLARIDAALAEMRRDGTLARILDRWSGQRAVVVTRNVAVIAALGGVALAVTLAGALWAWQRHVRRRSLREAAARSEARLGQAFELSKTGLAMLDQRGRVLLSNSSFDRLWAGAPPLREVVSSEDRPTLERALASGHDWGAELQLRPPEAPPRWVHLRLVGLPPDPTEGARTLLEVLDIDAQHAAGQAQAEVQSRLQAEKESAQQLADAKSRFLAQMSHEIRTPLHGVIGLTELSLAHPMSAAQRRYLDTALVSARQLLRVINDVLDHSSLASGAIVIVDEPFDLAQTLAESMRGVMPMARSKRLSMRYDYVGPSWVRGDAGRIAQIATNLVGNAVKFTEAGWVEMVCDVDEIGSDRGIVRLVVRDTGPGMTGDVVSRLFASFVQGDPTLARRHGGAGLGLAISRQLAQRMGGDITVESAPGEGSTFTLSLTLPLAPDPQPRLQPAAQGLALLVYQQVDIARWLARRVERLGWQCEVVPDVATAIARGPRAPRPDSVVIAEHVIGPSMDLAGLRKALPEACISVLVRPDWDLPDLEAEAPLQRVRIAMMPLTPRDVAGLLRVEQPARAAHATAPSRRVSGEVLVVEDNPVNTLVAESALRTLGLNTRAAENGRMALDACALSSPDLVLMDLQMPVLDGLAATAVLRERQRRGDLPWFPIVAVSAHALTEERERALAAGCDDYLCKPYAVDDLSAIVQRWMGMRERPINP